MHPLRTVLCASDLGEGAAEAIRQAAAVAGEDGAQLVVLYVVTDDVPPDGEVVAARAQALDHQLAAHPAAASATREVVRSAASVGEEILRRAERLRAGLVVVASHHRSAIGTVLLGSTALHVVRHAECPVLVARGRADRGKVVVATDLSLASLPALRVAAEEARRRRARLMAIFALELPPAELNLGGAVVPAPPEDPRSHPAQRSAAERRLAGFLRQAEVPAEPVVAEGAVAASIIALCEQPGTELAVVGTTGGRRLERVFLGGVAEAVVRRARCSVLTVPAVRVAVEGHALLDE
jgi:nucleotide-binding universal stress UspA family protein